MRRVYNPLGFSKGYNAILGAFLLTHVPLTTTTNQGTSSISRTWLSIRFHPRTPPVPLLQRRILQPKRIRRHRRRTRRVLLLSPSTFQNWLVPLPPRTLITLIQILTRSKKA